MLRINCLSVIAMLWFLGVALFASVFVIMFPFLEHIVDVGGGYSSKVMCTGVFLSNRSYSSIFENELAVGGSNLFIVPEVNWEEQSVSTSLFGLGNALSEMLHLPIRKAMYLGPQFGCQLQVDNMASQGPLRNKEQIVTRKVSDDILAESPEGMEGLDLKCLRNFIAKDFGPEAIIRNQTRAIVISYQQRVIAEGYQEGMGITASTPLLGWSMTKSVMAMIVGAAIQEGILTLDTPLQLHDLSEAKKQYIITCNNGHPLLIRDLLIMNDVMWMDENYAIHREVVQMLYGSFDMSQYTATVSTHQQGPPPSPSPSSPSSPWAWYYSSAVSNLLAKELRSHFPSDDSYWAFPHSALFDKVGASSFALEIDPSGTFVASSFGYATGRDWTRLGEVLLAGGVWRGQQVLPQWYVDFMRTPHPASGGHYGGHIWLNAAGVSVEEYNRLPWNHPRKVQCQWITRALPADAFYMSGHDGQFVFIMPSRQLVVSRLGFTHDEGGSVGYRGWDTEEFFSTIVNKCTK